MGKCPRCEGAGYHIITEPYRIKCALCNGKGRVGEIGIIVTQLRNKACLENTQRPLR